MTKIEEKDFLFYPSGKIVFRLNVFEFDENDWKQLILIIQQLNDKQPDPYFSDILKKWEENKDGDCSYTNFVWMLKMAKLIYINTQQTLRQYLKGIKKSKKDELDFVYIHSGMFGKYELEENKKILSLIPLEEAKEIRETGFDVRFPGESVVITDPEVCRLCEKFGLKFPPNTLLKGGEHGETYSTEPLQWDGFKQFTTKDGDTVRIYFNTLSFEDLIKGKPLLDDSSTLRVNGVDYEIKHTFILKHYLERRFLYPTVFTDGEFKNLNQCFKNSHELFKLDLMRNGGKDDVRTLTKAVNEFYPTPYSSSWETDTHFTTFWLDYFSMGTINSFIAEKLKGAIVKYPNEKVVTIEYEFDEHGFDDLFYKINDQVEELIFSISYEKYNHLTKGMENGELLPSYVIRNYKQANPTLKKISLSIGF